MNNMDNVNNMDKMLLSVGLSGRDDTDSMQEAHRATQVSLPQRTAPSSHLDGGDRLALNSKRATASPVGPDVALLPAGQSKLAKKTSTLS